MIKRIICVCMGNICRSPMAEALMIAKRPELPNIEEISSAGLGALAGSPADPQAIRVMAERGIDIKHHHARQLTPELIRNNDLVLVMEYWQVQDIESMDFRARGKVHLIGKWEQFEVPDPYGRSRHDFEIALKRIEQGIKNWIPKL